VCPTTRLRILDYLRKYQTASVRELSRALAMTGANIRHHMAVLESNDLIEAVSRRQEGRGRPANVFGLARRVLGDGLDELAGAMFDVWLKEAAEEVREAGLRSVAQRLAGENLPASNIPIPRRLALAVDRLNELHFQARWEASAAGPRILLGHCPYAEIVSRYPELCRIDAYLLELQLVLPARQTAKLERSATGLPHCAFVVG
jgi:predicted ArsR family transcriptional regulator